MDARINFSGYLHHEALFSEMDMKKVLSLLEPCLFYNVSSVQLEGSMPKSSADFLADYKKYLEGLVLDPIRQALFSHAIASAPEFFARLELPGGRFLLKPNRSVIQLQPLGLFISSINQELQVKTYAQTTQSFGLKISFPTIYETMNPHKLVEVGLQDPEYQKFIKLRGFIRSHTMPLIILKNGEKKVSTVRFSKDLKNTIAKMGFFKDKGLDVL